MMEIFKAATWFVVDKRVTLVTAVVRGMCTLKNPTAPEKPLGHAYTNFFKLKDTLPNNTGYMHDLRTGRLKYAKGRYAFAAFMVCFFPPCIIWQKLMKSA